MTSPQYIVTYNGYQMPGYLQQETFSSDMNIADHPAPYADGSISEYTGLQNKTVTLVFRTWESDYATCKEQVQKAATIVRSNRGGYAPLAINDASRHYDAMGASVKMDKSIGSSTRIVDYTAEFHCRPWLLSNDTYTIALGYRTDDDSGVTFSDLDPSYAYRMTAGPYGALDGPLAVFPSGIGNWDLVNGPYYRDMSSGGWSPTLVSMSGVTGGATITGYQIGPTGYPSEYNSVTVSGAHAWVTLDSDDFSGDFTLVDKVDFRTYAAPGPFYLVVSGVSYAAVSYQNRWYI